jgi:hypothetical protein
VFGYLLFYFGQSLTFGTLGSGTKSVRVLQPVGIVFTHHDAVFHSRSAGIGPHACHMSCNHIDCSPGHHTSQSSNCLGCLNRFKRQAPEDKHSPFPANQESTKSLGLFKSFFGLSRRLVLHTGTCNLTLAPSGSGELYGQETSNTSTNNSSGTGGAFMQQGPEQPTDAQSYSRTNIFEPDYIRRLRFLQDAIDLGYQVVLYPPSAPLPATGCQYIDSVPTSSALPVPLPQVSYGQAPLITTTQPHTDYMATRPDLTTPYELTNVAILNHFENGEYYTLLFLLSI